MADLTRPTVSGVYPVASATGVNPASPNIYAVFSEALLPVSVNGNTFYLISSGTFAPVPGSVSYTSADYSTHFTPSTQLAYNTYYSAYLVGKDLSTYEYGIKDTSGNALLTTYTWTFKTAPYTDTSYTGPTPTGTYIIPGTSGMYFSYPKLTVINNYPADYAYKIPTGIASIWMTLNDDLIVPSGYSLNDYVTMENTDALGLSTTSQTPYSVYYNNTNRQIIITPSEALQINSVYQVSFLPGLRGLNTEAMNTTFSFVFFTPLNPMLTSVEIIRLNLGSYIASIPDATIALLIYENSLYIIDVYKEVTGITLTTYESVPSYLFRYVICKTKLDLIHVRMLEEAARGEGVSKQLGDFKIERKLDPAKSFANPKIKALEDCIATALDQLADATVGMIQTGVKAAYDSRRPIATFQRLRWPLNGYRFSDFTFPSVVKESNTQLDPLDIIEET